MSKSHRSGFQNTRRSIAKLQSLEALEEIEKAIQLDPYNGEVYLVSGKIWAALGEKENALADVSTAINLRLPSEKTQEAEKLLSELEAELFADTP